MLRQAPDTALGSLWGTMRDFYLAETVLPNKYKELVGIAVSGATRCKYCACPCMTKRRGWPGSKLTA